MKRILNSNGVEIGFTDGTSVKDFEHNVIYRTIDDEVFQPITYVDQDLSNFNKGQMICIGKIEGNLAIDSNGEIIFRII